MARPACALLTVLVGAVALSGCPDPLPIDSHVFACRTNADCGRGAACDDGICRPLGFEEPDGAADADPVDTSEPLEPMLVGTPCTTPLVASRHAQSATFVVEVHPDTGQKYMRVEIGELSTLVPLDDDVLGLAEPPTAGACCEDSCCVLLGPPPQP